MISILKRRDEGLSLFRLMTILIHALIVADAVFKRRLSARSLFASPLLFIVRRAPPFLSLKKGYKELLLG